MSKNIRKYPEIFLISSLLLLCLAYLLHILYIKIRLDSWYSNNIDANQVGLRVYYENQKETDLTKRVSYSSTVDKKFQRNNFSLRAIGAFTAPRSGRYKFFLRSDDGSMLYIDQNLVVDNWGIHPSEEKAKTVPLKKGRHLVAIEYFQGWDKAELDFSWLKTQETERNNDLVVFFNPIRADFNWDKNIKQFEEIIKFPIYMYILILITIIIIWLISRLCLVIRAFRDHPIMQFLIKIAPALTVFISGIIIYRGVIFSTGPAFQVHDVEALVFPKYYFIRKAFVNGQFPLWDPYTMLGQPGIFSMGLAMLYPVLFGFLSMGIFDLFSPRYLELFIVAHLLFSGLTMYWSSRKLGLNRLGACLSGIVFQMAIINKDTMYSAPVAFSLPWIPLAVNFGIVLFRDKGPYYFKKEFLITIISMSFIISTTYPNVIVYTFLTLGIAMTFYIILRVIEKDWLCAVRIFSKGIWIFLIPLLLTAIITLPGYAALKESIRHNADVMKFGPLYLPFVWTVLFPGFSNWIEPPFAYIGVITILLTFYFCITQKRNGLNDGFLFVIIAIFWFYYSVQDSLLEKWLSNFPILKTMRLSQFALIIYIYAVSLLAGKGLERIAGLKAYKIWPNVNWLFPVFVVSMLIFTFPHFIKFHNVGKITSLFFGFVFIIYLLFQHFIKSNKFPYGIIPVIVILEIFMSAPPFVGRSDAQRFNPYKGRLKKFVSDFPAGFLDKDLYRIENFTEYTMADYYFDRFSTYGYFAQGTQSARYYYLWDRNARAGMRYEKWYHPWGIFPISLDSKLYDLMGVKYFYLPEHEWLFVDYNKSGSGEWIEVELEKGFLTSGIGIYNSQDPIARRILSATIVLNDKEKIHIDIPDSPGWHRFYFKPVKLFRLRIVADKVTPFGWEEGTVGVVIGEIEFLNKQGGKIDVPVKAFNASSTMLISSPSLIMDNRLDYVWESRCSVIASKTLPSNTLERVRQGCYINKDVLPRAFMVHKYKCMKNKDDLLRELHSEQFCPDETILLEEESAFDIPQGPYSDNAEITKYGLNEVEVTVKNNKPGFLILSDMYSPGWRVIIDGKSDKLFIADGAFRGVFMNTGEHKVVFKYIPPLFRIGSIVSIITALVLIIITFRVYK